jgi:hypothetical protein
MKINVIIRKWWEPERAAALIRAAGQDIALELAEYVADQARIYCPVLSGDLRRSIQVISSADLTQHFVIATMPYAEPVEFGYTHYITKRRIPPNPFMRKAVQDGAKRFPQLCRDVRVRQGFHRGAVMGVEIRAA